MDGFFGILHAQGNAGVFADRMFSLLTGSLIGTFHTVWTGIPIVLTLIGWAFVAKLALILVFLEIGLMSLSRSRAMPLMKVRIAGVGLILIATTLIYAIRSGHMSPQGKAQSNNRVHGTQLLVWRRFFVRAFVVTECMFEGGNRRFHCDGMPIGFRSGSLEYC
jgi:FtsH-binding integral membrane protein